MTIHHQKAPSQKIQVDLDSPLGNANALIGLAQSLGRQLKMSRTDIEAIVVDMQSSDYDHLIDVLDKKFGDFLDIYKA